MIVFVLHSQISTFNNYLLSLLMIIPIIYTTLLLKKKNASYFACVVFLSIVVNHMDDVYPQLFVINRVLDTLIGIFLSLIINQMHLPRRKHKDILFVSGIDDVLVNSHNQMSDYSVRQINCMIEDGMMFTLSSMRTVPVMLESIQCIHINLPVIAMDGAVLFDIHDKKYLKKYEISYEKSREVIDYIHQCGFHVFVNSIYEDSCIHYSEFYHDVEKTIFESLRKNPYRNYYQHDIDQVVTFGSIEGQYDVIVDHKDPNIVAKTLNKLYQPVCFLSSHF